MDHEPFWLGKLGLICNAVPLIWLSFAVVVRLMSYPSTLACKSANDHQMHAFPPAEPTTGDKVSYVSVVYALLLIFDILVGV